jgi:cell fate (sporulation/competence/biofilm development) regulator YlbF (YheA/YmcA/DUF963 family)
MILCLSTIFAQGQLQPQQDEETQKLYQEYNQLNQQLQQLQQEALSDEDIAQKGEALNNKITGAMVEKNPQIKETLDDRDKLIADYETAQQSGDQEALEQLGQQYQALSEKIETEQQKVMQNPELQTELQKFESLVMTKMEEINPSTPQLFGQMETLRNKLISQQKQDQN